MATRRIWDEELSCRFHHWMCELLDYLEAALEAAHDFAARHEQAKRKKQRSISPETALAAEIAHLSGLNLEEELKVDWAQSILKELSRRYNGDHFEDMADLENFIDISGIRHRLAAHTSSQDLVQVTRALNHNLHL